MYSKKILSTVAAIAVVSTGLMAFESDANGEIQVSQDGRTYNGGYTGGVSASSDLNLSTDQRGDALIYPFYRMDSGWATEMVVRNTTAKATVAKVVLYDKQDSEEIVDFNVYLSPYDAVRFVIKDNMITSKDGSIPLPDKSVNPKFGQDNDDTEFEHNKEVFNVIPSPMKKGNVGYAIVYGMTQYDDGDSRNTIDDSELNYHKDSSSKTLHNELWQDYRRVLDDCRPGWREAYKTGRTQRGFVHGMMTVDVPAPDTNVGCAGASDSVVDGYDLANFGDVAKDTLIGTVRVYKEDGVQSRDLLLPATALSNFTDENMLLWSEGEYAAIQDRRIKDGSYVKDDIRKDAKTFVIKSAYYTFAENSKANKLTITQPMKRILMQLTDPNEFGEFDTDGYWQNRSSIVPYGGFKLENNLFDEDERIDGESINITRGTFTSPFDTGVASESTYNDELHEFENIEELIEDGGVANSDYFKSTDGFIYLTFQGNENGLPAIVTQMTGSKVGGIAQTNWIYAPTIK